MGRKCRCRRAVISNLSTVPGFDRSMRRIFRGLGLLLIVSSTLARGTDGLQQMDFTVDGVARTALVHVPLSARTTNTPVVFVFHGHGGSAGQAARSFHMEREWPEAICVYMQGLPTPGQITDPDGKRTGWQAAPGDRKDRDIAFFDAVLARLEHLGKVDAKRIYCTGHSNGGSFTYLLWLTRGDVLAAVAPSAAAARYAGNLTPKPAMILGGRNDRLVKFSWQELTMNAVRKVNDCTETGESWNGVCTLYPSKINTPLVTCVFDGGHRFPNFAPALIAKFFRSQPGSSALKP